MNMHGIFSPAFEAQLQPQAGWQERALGWFRQWRMFLLIVVLPSVLVAGYYYLIAADQYESEAHFIIRSSENGGGGGSGFGAFLGFTAATSQSESEAASVSDYLQSHEAVAEMQREVNLVRLYRRPEADVFSRLGTDRPTPERLLKYYNGKVQIATNRDNHITTLLVRGFRPDDAHTIIDKLLAMGEARVNALNVRSYNDTLAASRRQLDDAEVAMAEVQARMTSFRQTRADIDPEGSGKAQIGLVSGLRADLAAAESRLQTMGASVSRSSPQYIALARQITSLRAQLAAQSGSLAGGTPESSTIARDLGGYESLKLRQEFVGKRYEAAAASLEQARQQAQRQQLYLVRVVDANMPVKSTYPKRGRTVLTIIIALLLVYSIGWLIAAGVREHAA